MQESEIQVFTITGCIESPLGKVIKHALVINITKCCSASRLLLVKLKSPLTSIHILQIIIAPLLNLALEKLHIPF